MPYTIPKKRKVLRTIRMTNGSILTAEMDASGVNGSHELYWFRDGKYITPEQSSKYKYYDNSIKGYRYLDNKRRFKYTPDAKEPEYEARTPVFTPSIQALESHIIGNSNTIDQSIPLNEQKMITLRTKGKMNLADVPENLLDSIAVNAGRSGTDFWTDAALVGKESTFGGGSAALKHPFDLNWKESLYPEVLVNNHAYLETPESDYLAALHKKYDFDNDYQKARAEENAKYALEHGQIVDKTPHYSNYILADAFKRYQVAPTKYNPGQKNYVPMLNGIRTELQGEKQLQEYWNTRGKQEYARGQKEGMAEGGPVDRKNWNSLSMAERAEAIKIAVKHGITDLGSIRDKYNEFASGGSIHIDPSKKGTFTAAASKHGKSVQEFASQVLANKDNYSPAMVKKANFARNASKWGH